MIEIYTDGSARNNGSENSQGGFGVAVFNVAKDNQLQPLMFYSQQGRGITNNQMELKALLYALDLAQTSYAYDICKIKSDSAYCVNMFNDWIEKWARNDWMRAGNKPIENIDLVLEIWKYKNINYPNFVVEKTSGHNGIVGNEIADALATNDRTKLEKILIQNNMKHTETTNIDF